MQQEWSGACTFCLFQKFSGDPDAAGLQTTLGAAKILYYGNKNANLW